MAWVDLNFPVFYTLVGEGNERRVRAWPLLLPRLMVEGASAQSTTTRLLSRVREALREDMDLCRALTALPDEGQPWVEPLRVSSKEGRVERVLRAALYTLNGQRWAVFPRLGPGVMPLPELPDDQLGQALQDAVDAIARLSRPSAEEAEEWEEQKGDRVVTLSMGVDLRWPPIAPELSLSSFLEGLGEQTLNGEVELNAVGRSLKARYPEQLLYDHVPSPLVPELSEALFVGPPSALVVLGEPGRGRSTLIHAALRRRLDDWVKSHGPDTGPLPDIWLVDPNRVISGQAVVGAWQRRLQAILGHLCRTGPTRKRPDVLYIDNPVALARVGRSRGSEMTLSRMLRPWLERQKLPLVIEASPEQWRRLEELDRPFTDLFRVLRLPPASREQVARMVVSKLPSLEQETGARASPAALRELLALSYRSGRAQPGAALSALHDMARRLRGPIGVPEVRAAFAEESGLRDEWLGRSGAPLDPDKLRARISEQLAGQPDAVTFIERCLLLLREGLTRPGRPVASALLVGPTGVGKTETARVLSRMLFRGEDHLLRFDMNELVDADAPRRLIGDLWSEGLLTSRVRHRPVAVVLLDEIEKAHPSVHDLLLQVLDEGRLTDARGQTADFQRCVVLMTSNVGASEVSRSAGFGRDNVDLARSFRSAAQRHFRPELINRIDQIIAYSPLSPSDLRRVAAHQLRDLLGREAFLRRTVFVDLGGALLDRLVQAAAGSTGARALKRAIEQDIAVPLAEQLLEHPLELPLLLRCESNSLALRVHPIPYSTQRLDPDLVEQAPSTTTLLRDLERHRGAGGLIASWGPSGPVLHGSHLAQQLQDLLSGYMDEDDLFDEDHADPQLTDQQVWRARGRSAHVRRVKDTGTFRPDWTAAASFRTVRSYLLQATTEAMEASAVAVEPRGDHNSDWLRAVVAWQLACLPRGEQAFLLRMRSLTPETPAFWGHVAGWLTSLQHSLRVVGRYCELRAHTPDRGWRTLETPEETPPGPRALHGVGCGVEPLLQAEQGLHVFWVNDEPPIALQAQLVAPDTLDSPWPEPEEVVRLYLATQEPGRGTELTQITDLRLGTTGYDRVPSLGPAAMQALLALKGGA